MSDDTERETAAEVFVRVALESPSQGQLIRALEALSHYLQRGQTWLGYAQRLAELETLAHERTRDAVARGAHADGAAQIMTVLRDSGLQGNRDTYEDVHNSFVDRVLESGHGLPITLSALAVHLAEVAGVDLRGIGFPGHFIVGAALDGAAPTIFDPFEGGRILSFSELAALYSNATGRQITAHAAILRDALAPASTHTILVRVCNNLRHHYLLRGSQDRAAEVVALLCALQPRIRGLRTLATQLGRRVESLN